MHMRNQNRVETIGLPSGNQSANCAYSDSLCICVDLSWYPLLRISSNIFCPDEDTKREHKMHVQL